MRLLITGGRGQLGRELVRALAEAPGAPHEISDFVGTPPGAQVWAPGREELDVAREGAALGALEAFGPSLVIHAAAYTDTAGCQRHPERAFLVNAQGTRNVAEACGRLGVPLVYVSTNEVFDGRQGEPYQEMDEPSPINVYGRSKLAGEEEVRRLLERFYIVRTAWLYGRGEENFPAKILRAVARGEPLRLVTDEVASPTWARELAQAIVRLLGLAASPIGASARAGAAANPQPLGGAPPAAPGELGWAGPAPYGIYHLTNQGFCSRYEWARRFLELAAISAPLEAVTQAQFGFPAAKPAFSALANVRAAALGVALGPWEEALARYLAEGSP